MNKIKRLKDLALYEYFVKIDDKFVDITKDLIKYNSEKLKEINKLEKENKELQQRIDKAIEYIESHWIEYEEAKYIKMNWDELEIPIEEIKKLLEILGDKECIEK